MTPPRRPLGHGRATPTTDPANGVATPPSPAPPQRPAAASDRPTATPADTEPDSTATAEDRPQPSATTQETAAAPADVAADGESGEPAVGQPTTAAEPTTAPLAGAVPHRRAAAPTDGDVEADTAQEDAEPDEGHGAAAHGGVVAQRGPTPSVGADGDDDAAGDDAAGDESAVSVGAAVVEPEGMGPADGAEARSAEPEPPLAAALEAILLVADQPIPEVNLAQILERPQGEVTAALHALAAEYTAAGRGFDLREVAGGWRYYTRASCSSVVERYVTDGQNARLTQAALETLAVVAYRQPVSRARVSAIRGVNCDGVMRTLLTRGLVEEAGTERESGALLYRTTGYFLERMGLRSLDELPEIAPYLPEGATLEEIEAVESAP